MVMWTKAVLLVAILSLHGCFAKKSLSPPVSRNSGSTRITNAQSTTRAVHDAKRRASSDYYDDEDEDEGEDSSLDGWSDSNSWAELGNELPAVDAGDSYEESIDSSEDWRLARDDRRYPTRRQQTLTPNIDDEGDDYDDDYLDDEFIRGPSRWKSNGNGMAQEDYSEKDYDNDGHSENYDDYDDEDDDDYGVPNRRGVRPSPWTGHDTSATARGTRWRSTSRGSSRGSVVRYQRERRATSRGFNVKIPALSGAAIASVLRRQIGSAREAVGQASTIATSTSKRLKREVKLVVSGSWESALLKVTWPDDLPPDDDLVDTLVEAVRAFRLDRDVTKNSAEHRVLLRKLWTKMSELDWRTVAKAVHLFHIILQEISSEQHSVFKIFLGKMSREPDKRTGGRYFDLDVLCGVSTDGEAFRSFLGRYASYVFKRARDFSARFQELDKMQSGEGWEHIVTMLVNAQKAIDLGVSCFLEPEEETEMTVLCLRSTAYDIRQLWRRYDSALAWVLEEGVNGDLFAGVDADVVGECLEEFKEFYLTRYEEVAAFLSDVENLLAIYDVDAPELGLPPSRDFSSISLSTEIAAEDMEDEGGADDDHTDRAAVSKPSSMRPKEDLEASRAAGDEDGGSGVIAKNNAGDVGDAIRSSFRGKVGGVNGRDDVEEDSAEEGAVDEHVDDLTFFDDATQPEGTDPDWD